MISPRPSNVGADILPAMPMRPFYGVDVTLVDEKVGFNIAIHSVLQAVVEQLTMTHGPTTTQ